MAALSELLDQLATDERRKGRQFERLCKWYLKFAPKYRSQLRCVWLWDEWPERWGPDAGIDLVAETKSGDLWAIQAKAYDLGSTVTKRDVDSFLSESSRAEFSYRLLIATTDHLSHNADRTIQSQEKAVHWVGRSELMAEELDWPESFDALGPRKQQRKNPRPHQREALANIQRGFHRHDRGQAVMACGTGKTLVGLWLHERRKSKRTLLLVPSLSLLRQTLDEWTTNARHRFDYLAVCSDETVADADAVVSNTSELGVPVTTDPRDIRKFLRQDSGTQVVFSTYQEDVPTVVELRRRSAAQAT